MPKLSQPVKFIPKIKRFPLRCGASHFCLNPFIGDLNPIPCGATPEPPKNVQAYPVSSQQIVVYWTKPVGPGYTSKVTVGNSPSEKDRGVSPALAEGITGLNANTNYTVSVQLSCTGKGGEFSTAATTTVKTFPTGAVNTVFSLMHHSFLLCIIRQSVQVNNVENQLLFRSRSSSVLHQSTTGPNKRRSFSFKL